MPVHRDESVQSSFTLRKMCKEFLSRHTWLAVENIHSSIGQRFSFSSSWPALLKTHVFKKKYRPFDSAVNSKRTISTAKWNKCLIKFQPALFSFCIVIKHLGDNDIYHFTFVKKKHSSKVWVTVFPQVIIEAALHEFVFKGPGKDPSQINSPAECRCQWVHIDWSKYSVPFGMP